VLVRGDDDFFSSDLGEEEVKRIWGGLKRPVLILPSEEDEWVPKGVDVEGLLRTWMTACGEGIASEEIGVIPGANHRVDEEEGQKWMAERVIRFLKWLEAR
jgi:alpha-beta hydrolase superfamily lysophospholipase